MLSLDYNRGGSKVMKQKSKSHKKNSGGRKTRGGGKDVKTFIESYNAILDQLIIDNTDPVFKTKIDIFKATFDNYDDNITSAQVDIVKIFTDIPKVSKIMTYNPEYKILFEELAKDDNVNDNSTMIPNEVKKAYNDIMESKEIGFLQAPLP